ncbi:MAG: hypothetical protein HQL57_04205 [Magnetococcales bacterium]|nr:hypothetical protein [Magnetococcales bacterium]
MTRANALLAGIGYNLRAILRKLRLLFVWILAALVRAFGSETRPRSLITA